MRPEDMSGFLFRSPSNQWRADLPATGRHIGPPLQKIGFRLLNYLQLTFNNLPINFVVQSTF